MIYCFSVLVIYMGQFRDKCSSDNSFHAAEILHSSLNFRKLNPRRQQWCMPQLLTCPRTGTSFSTKTILISFGETCLSPHSVPEVRNSRVTWAWPTRDWFRGSFISKAEPMRTCPGILVGAIEKDMLYPLGLLMLGAAA